MSKSVIKTPWYSFKTGKLCKGCAQCVEGKKTVLFITGLCMRKCFYCPISSSKYGSDVVFANEWQIKDNKNPVELFEEVKLTGAQGAGITGGDPLIKIDRTINYIELLKKEFGESFHIHLYTSLNLANEDNLKKLFYAGLDEIRFHPSFDDSSLWDNILVAKKFNWSVGVEIPVVPGTQNKTERLIEFIAGKIDFLNLNELEFSDTDSSHYDMSGYFRKNNSSYAVKGSRVLALKLLDKCSKLNINAHFCTAKLKNMVQVGERLKRRALNIALDIDELTEEYLLYRGAIYLKGFEPGSDYRQGSLKKASLYKLNKAKLSLLKSGLFDEDDLVVDSVRSRFLTHFSLVERYAERIKELDLTPCIVEEYPSSDFFCVELEFL
ncbi:MAG: radical SAM protein [Candidatus Woesearchaeota archaeon]